MQLELALVQTGVISADDYVAALARRDQERPPLGQVAIELGMMAATNVLDVLRVQHTDPTRRFGELAVEMGHLDSHQVAALLMEQQERQRPLIEHLVALGRLSREQARSARENGVARSVSLLA